MAKFENTMGIDSITMGPINTKVFCPIGKTWCTYEVTIKVNPDRFVCDYLDVDEFVKKGAPREATMEDFCSNVLDYMLSSIGPKAATVEVACHDASHMPVSLSKSYTTDKFKEENGNA